MNDFLSGVVVTLSIAIGLFQLRFWRKTKDRLFVWFFVSFVFFAFTRCGLFVLDDDSETRTYFYLLRLVAFLLIIVAVVDKNRRARL